MTKDQIQSAIHADITAGFMAEFRMRIEELDSREKTQGEVIALMRARMNQDLRRIEQNGVRL